MNATSLTSLNSRNALKAIRDISDVDVLREALEQEGASESPRSTVMGAIQMRIDTLPDEGGEIVVDDAAWQIKSNENGSISEADTGAVVVPAADVADDSAPEVAISSSINDCALAFFAALRSGDEKLVTVLISEVRREDADDAAMAAALINAFSTIKAQAKSQANKSERKPQAKKEPGDRAMARLLEGIKAGSTDDDGVVTINRAAMDAAGWTRVWFGWAHEWDCGKTGNARLGAKGVLAQAAGYTANLANEDSDEAVLTLTPISE